MHDRFHARLIGPCRVKPLWNQVGKHNSSATNLAKWGVLVLGKNFSFRYLVSLEGERIIRVFAAIRGWGWRLVHRATIPYETQIPRRAKYGARGESCAMLCWPRPGSASRVRCS